MNVQDSTSRTFDQKRKQEAWERKSPTGQWPPPPDSYETALLEIFKDFSPGKVLDVHYEETVTDLEGQVRRILDHCGLPFEENCLRFYETERAVNTASSEP